MFNYLVYLASLTFIATFTSSSELAKAMKKKFLLRARQDISYFCNLQ